MNNNLKIKDILLIALLTAVYILVYFVTMGITTLLGAFGHAISPGICGVMACWVNSRSPWRGKDLAPM